MLPRWTLSLLLISTPLAAAEPAKPIDLGSKRELFVDRYMIDSAKDVTLRLETPRDEGVAIPLDKPWEGPFSTYATVLRDGNEFRMYYRGTPESRRSAANRAEIETTCVAISKDGIHWTKPELGLFEVLGSKANNVVLYAPEAKFTHNFCPMIDTRPGVPKEERYKALAGERKGGLGAFASEDGFRWKLIKEAVITEGAFDSQNVPMWSESEQCYVCYLRVFVDKVRRISRTTSKDFLTWTAPELMGYSDDRPVEHLYTNQTSPYFRAPHIYLGIAARFMPGRQVLTPEQAEAIKLNPGYFKDCSDAVLITTRGGNTYDRTFPEGFLVPGIGPENWSSRTNYPARNLVQTGPSEMSFYVTQSYGQPTIHFRRYSLRLDGFSAATAPYTGGELVTKPFTFAGKELSLNFATSAAGGITVELQDANGKPIPGYAAADAVETIGNEIDRVVRWKAGPDVSSLAGKPVRMRLVMKDAKLYSFQFRN